MKKLLQLINNKNKALSKKQMQLVKGGLRTILKQADSNTAAIEQKAMACGATITHTTMGGCDVTCIDW